MAQTWRRDRRLYLQLVRIEEKLDELIQLERGLIPVSNDPTELEIANGEKRQLHSWLINKEGLTICFHCGTLLTDCGATNDSWYCQ